MAKAGSAYNELAARLAEALEPDAEVKVGKWVEGPDGKREIDVEVRRKVEGGSFFLLIECKDWADPVGIEEIDKLDFEGQRRFGGSSDHFQQLWFHKESSPESTPSWDRSTIGARCRQQACQNQHNACVCGKSLIGGSVVTGCLPNPRK